ncbi:MAG TPA: 4'-phosphopantetheinyl transferase superfamily protein [Micromonosporaceae bacterium]|nr:4'-phosphopantetheinyl transferase superfamily protein [Micromonosporaceae bacterium]
MAEPVNRTEPIRPEQDVVQVYWARLADADPRLLDLLNVVERDRHAGYRRPEDADRFLLGAAMVRIVAGRHSDRPPATVIVDRSCPDCDRPHGKVALPGSDLELSVSHSGDLVGLACHAGSAIGLDVEHLDRFNNRAGASPEPGLVDYVLTDSERSHLDTLNPDHRLRGFLRYWTRKEALLKATGDGLRVDLRSLVLSGPDDPPALLESSRLPRSELTLYDLTAAPDHIAALAVRQTHPVRIVELPADPLLARV